MFCDGSVPVFSRDEVAAILHEVEDRIVSARAFAEGAEYRYGVNHTEVAYYCGAEAIAIEVAMIIAQRLGFR